MPQEILEIIAKAEGDQELLDGFLKKAKDLINYDWWGMYILNEETNQYEVRAKSNEAKKIETNIDFLIEDGIIDWVLRNYKPRFISPITDNLLFFIIPIVIAKKPIGFVVFKISSKQAFNKNLHSLSLQATLLGLMFQGTMYRESVWDKVNKLKFLMEIAQKITFSTNVDRLLESIMEVLNNTVRTEYSCISLLDENKKLILKKSSDFKWPIKPTEVCYFVINHAKPIHISDFKQDIRFKNSMEPSNLRNVLSFPLETQNTILGALTLYNRLGLPDFTKDDFIFLFALSNQAALAIKLISLYDKLKKAYKETVLALAEAIEAKDPYTRGHIERVTRYALMLAKEMKFKPSDIETLEFASLLHDIGKIGISEAILKKPGKLTAQEFREIMKHPVIGEQIVKKVSFLKKASIIIRQHHERFDGSGYPDGLKGKKIEKLSRILAIADAFDAMTSERPYKKRLNIEQALEEIKKNKGKQFDPEICEVALKVFG